MPTRAPASAPASDAKCRKYCIKDFIPERERVEAKAYAEQHRRYVPVDKRPKDSNAKLVKKLYVETCETIYCNPKCGFKDIKAKYTTNGNCYKLFKHPDGDVRDTPCKSTKVPVKKPTAPKAFVDTVSEKRKKNVTTRGAQSVCRDLVKEFPKYYRASGNI
jgi:hypothetical protein